MRIEGRTNYRAGSATGRQAQFNAIVLKLTFSTLYIESGSLPHPYITV